MKSQSPKEKFGCAYQRLLAALVFMCFLGPLPKSFAQPWNTLLLMAYSDDGVSFGTPVPFQDSSGVPSAVKWRGDSLVCVFQWARQPMGSPTWDQVAVKFSPDNGSHWTSPQPIQMHGMPASYQRPFDPTLVVLPSDSLRMYFSSSDGQPPPGGDSLINTYSARSADGINFFFEPGARVDHPTRRVIDPAVVRFNNAWHYASPIGAPQEGAFHYLSDDGIRFSQVANIPSDPQHNWTGNFVVVTASELRFYGSGVPYIWFNTSSNGGVWTGYTNTSLSGGDPTVVRLNDQSYLAIFVAPPHLNAPTSMTIAVQDGAVALRWSIVAGAGSYRVYVAPDENGPWFERGVSTNATFTDTLDQSSRVFYFVTALGQ